MTEDEAEKLNTLILQLAARLDESAAFVRDKDDESDWDEYRRVVGRALAGVFDLGELLWRRFPELKPKQLGGSCDVDTRIYDPPFYVCQGADWPLR